MRIAPFLLLLTGAAALAAPADAWGGTGHTLISRAAAEALPVTLPAFVRSPAAVDEIAALGPEPDRSRDAGRTHDADLDPGHYLDVGDDGKVGGVVELSALPLSRQEYDTALRASGSNEYRAGYLPYAIVEGWQQVAKDFAIWRVDAVGERTAANAPDRTWFGADRALREALTLRDIGVWSHFVADGSQPLHVTVHYNGWGSGPNRGHYSLSHEVHANFEGSFVRAHAGLDAVKEHMRPQESASGPILQLVGAYLRATASHVVPLYELERRGAFTRATPAAVDFTNARLADGSSELRDLIVAAWEGSASLTVGYPHGLTPAQAESGAAVPLRAGLDAAD